MQLNGQGDRCCLAFQRSVAFTRPRKSGCGRAGRLLNSEWGCHKAAVLRQLHRFHNVSIRRGAADDQPFGSEGLAEIIVEFIAAAVALRNLAFAQQLSARAPSAAFPARPS